MVRNVYALLVGINDYSRNVGKLSGCLNDVDHFQGYLTENFDRGRLHIEVLKDADATRPNIIQQFRSHLGKAKADDVVVFQYSGHGARCKSARPFGQFYPDGWDEGLVCYDSRGLGGLDLAAKEFAILLADLAKNDPHVAAIILISEVIQTPGAMPLLSFTLSELYIRYIERRADGRCLAAEDYARCSLIHFRALWVEFSLSVQ